MHVRVCPDCGEEFRPEIARCSDCGAVLRDRFEDDVTGEVREEGVGIEVPEASAPSVEIRRRSLFSSNRLTEVQPLTDRLASGGIRFWVEAVGDSWTVLVGEDDEAQGRELLRELFGIEDATSAPFDPEAGYASCPACDHALPPKAAECPACGLAIAGEPEDLG